MSRPYLCLFAALALLFGAVARADYDYRLRAEQIAPGVYAVMGGTEHFSNRNGGNIVNTGFIVSQAGVLVIDTGPSRLYGEQLRALITRTTDQPIARVINTHHHPDHFFGNQAFAGLPIAALAGSIAAMQQEATGFADNLYRLIGNAMLGTEVVLPTERLAAGSIELGERRLQLLALDGHSGADLALLDETSGVLFASDLVSNRRAPTTPHANLARWQAALDRLQGQKIQRLVPGHGPMADATAIDDTRAYLAWLNARLREAAEQGMDMAELMFLPLPERFASWGAMPGEYQRSVAHLYPTHEAASLPAPAVHDKD